MTEKQKYASDWEKSSDDFVKQNIYNKLSEQLSSFPIILEIGCGTGQSTLSLLENGHGVICIEQNDECLVKAQERIRNTNFTVKDNPKKLKQGEVYFILGDVTDCVFMNNLLSNIDILNVVLCWNVGTYWDIERKDIINKLLKQWNFDDRYINEMPESAYVELIILIACQIAKIQSCALHIVDRGTKNISRENDPYYYGLKTEFGFNKISYKNIKASTLSQSGRKMISDGNVIEMDKVGITLYSILIE